MKLALIGLSFMALTGFDVNAMDIQKEQRLPALSEKDQAATTGVSIYHSQWVKDNFGAMHSFGDTWPEDKLERIFLEGLFQHYTHQFSQFSYVYDYRRSPYEQLEAWSQRDIPPMKVIWKDISPEMMRGGVKTKSEDISDKTIALADWLRAVAEALKQNKVFRHLGADFQQIKVIVEKAEEAVRRASEMEKEEALRKVYALDRKATDIQTLIFHWMHQTYAQAKAYLKDYMHSHEGQLPPLTDPYIAKITTTYPEFAYWPVYAALLRELPPLPVKKRSIEEFTQDITALSQDFEIIGKLHEAAKKAFKDNASDKDMKAYSELFQKAQAVLQSVFEIKKEEESNFEQALERVAAG